MFSAIFKSYGLENKSMGVVFRVEFDGDVRFFVAPPKSMFLLILKCVFRCFLQFFRFPSFRKNLDFFFCAAAEPKSLPPQPRQPLGCPGVLISVSRLLSDL